MKEKIITFRLLKELGNRCAESCSIADTNSVLQNFWDALEESHPLSTEQSQ